MQTQKHGCVQMKVYAQGKGMDKVFIEASFLNCFTFSDLLFHIIIPATKTNWPLYY